MEESVAYFIEVKSNDESLDFLVVKVFNKVHDLISKVFSIFSLISTLKVFPKLILIPRAYKFLISLCNVLSIDLH